MKSTKKLYLSKRNLLVLLSKLERKSRGEKTACTIEKYRNSSDPFVNDFDEILVIAVPDEEFYVNRDPGIVHPSDEPK
jgi:hypothetical protein